MIHSGCGEDIMKEPNENFTCSFDVPASTAREDGREKSRTERLRDPSVARKYAQVVRQSPEKTL
jgi:hypothetical protein